MIDTFIARWIASSAAERANFQMFIGELATLLGVEQPHPSGSDDERNAYVYERAVTFRNPDGTTSPGRIDLYKRGSFVMEGKQGSESTTPAEPGALPSPKKKLKKGTAVRGTKTWDSAMLSARYQAEGYVKALPPSEGNPPFILVVDVGHMIELYADFSRSGKAYLPFPDARNYRLMLKDLERPEIRERLQAIWNDPMSLDPSRRSARVTRDVAAKLAALARSFEQSGESPERVASFLMRCIFTMFAEDVKLIPDRSFTTLLETLRDDVAVFPDAVSSLWSEMDRGGFSPTLKKKLLRFNGGLFENTEALPLSLDQLDLLIEAGKADWHDVEPAIFGTLLERALDPVERHKLGAHYTPRAYVERLVMPTIVEPLREEWDATLAAAVTHASAGRLGDAIEETRAFHRRLCTLRVLDPACGTGNFLYVTLEHLKRLEGEVLDQLGQFGASEQTLDLAGLTVDPHQLLGIEINPRAAAIADLVLWIGHLQWHFRTHGDALPREPVLHQYHNIENRDALLDYDAVEPLLDESGNPVTRWDGRTMKRHPVTGEDVPDEKARVTEMRYVNARKAEWPEAEFIVGNPPFIGNKMMLETLGEGYTKAIRKVYRETPDSCDFVMYWWNESANLIAGNKAKRFGLITTNSITQTFNRRILESHLNGTEPIKLVYCIPDHPWSDATTDAAVRIAMTVGESGSGPGVFDQVVEESANPEGDIWVRLVSAHGIISPNLRVGSDPTQSTPLKSNGSLCGQGMKLVGDGFYIEPNDTERLRNSPAVRRIVAPQDVLRGNPGRLVIDFFGLSEQEAKQLDVTAYQQVLTRVKPFRDQNRRDSIRQLWWRYAWDRPVIRAAIAGLGRYYVTLETSKYRFFAPVAADLLWDGSLFAIAVEDLSLAAILNSRIHGFWALRTGGQLGPTPRYNRTLSFEAFPFPDILSRDLGLNDLEVALEKHWETRLSLHEKLTITDMYNVLEKLRSGEPLTAKEKKTHEDGLVSVLKQIHDDLDRAVMEAYGWSDLIPLLDDYARREELEQKILERLVALNAERAEEEMRGIIRWLRPEFQNPGGSGTQQGLSMPEEEAVATPAAPIAVEKAPWPKPLKEQLLAVRSTLAASGAVMSTDQVVRSFTGARKERVGEILETLVSLGQAREVEDERYVI